MWTLFCDVYYVGTSFYRGRSATFCFALLYPYVLPGVQMSSGFQTFSLQAVTLTFESVRN